MSWEALEKAYFQTMKSRNPRATRENADLVEIRMTGEVFLSALHKAYDMGAKDERARKGLEHAGTES